MIKLKGLFIIMCLLLFGCVSFKKTQNQEKFAIGVMQGTKPTITMDLNLIKHNLESFLKANGDINVTFSDFEIRLSGDTYGLFATNKENSVNTVLVLELKKGKFYESRSNYKSSLVITCKGCKSGCAPNFIKKEGFCKTDCNDCEKTETLTQKPLFP